MKNKMKKKCGRPKIHRHQKRLSISFSDEAWAILELVRLGKRSELVSKVIGSYACEFPEFFEETKRK
jgi:hypothetical protein